MINYNQKSIILITCPIKITPSLRKEIEEYGYKIKEELPAAVKLEGTLEDCIRLNILLRTGHKVLFQLKTFPAKNLDELYKKINDMPWESLIPDSGYFSVDSTVTHEQINDTRFPNLKCKDAIADRFVSKKGIRPDSGPDKSKTVISLFWREGIAQIYLDTSGENLSKHGYRKIPSKAPLRETLAAAMIYASRWDRNSVFINPMCGSGTLAIEAALLMTDRAPGLLRSNFGFMHILPFDEEHYQNIRKEIKNKPKKTFPFKLIATDIDPNAIDAAKRNADTAGVSHLIEFITCPFEETPVPEEHRGIVIFNPEYGERLGEEEELQKVYANIGDFMKKKCQGYTGYIFTGNPDLAKEIGLRTSRKIPFFNGTIECRLLEYELYSGSKKKPKTE